MKIMNLLQLISKNNLLKFSLVFITIFFISLNAQSEIPEKYKIESSLKKCKGKDYKKWTNCYGEFVFPRNEYKGEWKNGKIHGKGVLKEAYGGIYVGEFKNNLANGKGFQIELDGTKSEGIWKNDLMNGPGIITFPNGTYMKGNFVNWVLDGDGEIRYENTTYVGQFKEGFADGYGVLKYDTGGFYEGYFESDLRHGFGKESWPNGDKFEGNWKEDLREGEGTMYWKDGDKYIGNWKDDVFNGYGEFYYASGDIYKGNWVDGSKKGMGEYKFNTGDKYVGEFNAGIRNGSGEYRYANGIIYNGNWVDRNENGNGKMTWQDGEYYEGNWINGYRTGIGKYVYSSGTIYEGEFFESTAEGMGKFTYEGGTIYEGEVSGGYENGQGKIKYSNGDLYTGQFKDGYEHGQGKMVYADGTIYEGLWEDGKEAEGKTTLAKFTTDEKYYALIIGNNNYEKLEDLDNAVNDAKDLEKVLKEKYGFETTLLIDEKSDETENAIIKFTQNREKNDNILIYYAGHGELVKKQNRGYWLPTDAGPTQDSKWLSNNNIKDLISSSEAKHVLLIVDSCFSGSLMRGSGDQKSVEKLTSKRIARLQAKKTRIVITSGGNEQVVDGIGASTNSVFAQPLIKYLKENTDVIQSIKLFQKVQSYVIDNADQTPNHSTIHGTGHDGGEFLFFPIS